jgi:hypothetical protein
LTGSRKVAADGDVILVLDSDSNRVRMTAIQAKPFQDDYMSTEIFME